MDDFHVVDVLDRVEELASVFSDVLVGDRPPEVPVDVLEGCGDELHVDIQFHGSFGEAIVLHYMGMLQLGQD